MKHHITPTLFVLCALLLPHALHAETSPLFQYDPLTPQVGLSLHYKIQTGKRKGSTKNIALRITQTHKNTVAFEYVHPKTNRKRSRYQPMKPLVAQRNLHKARIDLSFLKSDQRYWQRSRYGSNTTPKHSPYLWVSTRFCEELKRFGQTSSLGQYGRKTTFTTFRHHTHTVLSEDGPITLPTLQISTPNNTYVSVLDDCSNPLVLEIKEPSGFHFTLHRVERPQDRSLQRIDTRTPP